MSRDKSRARRAEIQPTIGLIVEGDAEFAAFMKLDFPTARTHAKGASGSKSLDKFLRTLGV